MTQSTFWAEYFVRISDYPFLDVRTEKKMGDREVHAGFRDYAGVV